MWRAILVVALVAVPAALPPAPAAASTRGGPVLAAAHPAMMPVAFRSRFRLGGSRSRGYGFGYTRSRPGHSLLHRAVKTAIWLYVLHLFFTHGGVSVLLWIMIIGLVIALARRRRRYSYWRGAG